ncbi:MAG: cytochrome c oxidase subunit II [Caldilineaceae bacterium]
MHDSHTSQKASSSTRHFVNAGVLVVVATILINWLMNKALPFPPQASTQSVIIDQLFRYHVLLIAFLFSLVVVFMLYALVVFRRREGDDGEGDHFEGNTTLEIFWTAAPMVFVIVFAYLGITTINEVTKVQENEAVVQVEGFQWGWTFTYPDGVVSDELVLQNNVPVKLELRSKDVLHSFWVPAFRMKQDLVPGEQNVKEIRFTPSLEGEYAVRCAELCGLSHYSMVKNVRVVSETAYKEWHNQELAKINPALAKK